MTQDPLHLLCVEPRFPGKLGAVADWLVRKRGYRCWFYCSQADAEETWPESVGKGLEIVGFGVGGVAKEPSVAWTRQLERGLCYAYGAWEVLESRRPRPIDIVLGRSGGLGSTLFVPVFAPHTPIVNLFDEFQHPRTHDLADELVPQLPPEYVQWRISSNAMELLDLENGVHPWTTSPWLRDLYPPEYREGFQVCPEGVDIKKYARIPKGSRPRIIAGREVPNPWKIVSFVARTPDRLRGFDRFLALANQLLRERSDVLIVVAGGGSVRRMLDIQCYGRDYLAMALQENPPADLSRFWSLGLASPGDVADLLAVTDLHVDPSRPYRVSRSTLEALSAGAVVLAWDSAPLREVIDPGQTGLLVSPDDPAAPLRQALEVLDDLDGHRPLGEAATVMVREKFDRDQNLAKLASWLDELAKGKERES